MKELNELIESYLLNNTFNNIQILLTNREILKLDEDSLDKKIEREKKGGYCFEHNQH
ncbi:arylamine N-acetyltransferase, partial [Bacteriovorax sp. DB6_IX]|uniref:arylamine N-acetyltransferase n=1 Tax=Bacteriovorax sp. DB6_IX TaxID=1353530 RepID=UPI000389DC63